MKVFLSILFALSAGAAIAQCCGEEAASAEKQAKIQANIAKVKAQGKEACCKTDDKKAVAKGEAGCCNEKGQLAKFKVWVVNEGYRFFGCEGSANKGREELSTQGYRVGNVQKVLSRVRIAA
jgi:hypothetical protein